MNRTLTLRHALLGATLIATVIALVVTPRMPQPLTYHRFADQRAWLGIPNTLDVVSNLPFLAVGLAGLLVTFRHTPRGGALFDDPLERWPYAVLFAGVALTAGGSAYYHLAPDNARLVWDRLPMAMGFMGLLTAVLAERVSLRAARWLLAPLVSIGLASVVHWYWTELQGAGDLRFYLVGQFGSLLLVLLLLANPARYRGTGYLVAGLGGYATAKVLEVADQAVFGLGQVASGHTLKHIVAAGAVACLVVMLGARRRAPMARAALDPSRPVAARIASPV